MKKTRLTSSSDAAAPTAVCIKAPVLDAPQKWLCAALNTREPQSCVYFLFHLVDLITRSCCLKPGGDWLCCGGSDNDDGKFCQIGLGCCAIACIDAHPAFHIVRALGNAGTGQKPSTCIKIQAQLCCIVKSCALPPDPEIPATIACFGVACLPKCGFCIHLESAASKAGGPSAPEDACGKQLAASVQLTPMQRD